MTDTQERQETARDKTVGASVSQAELDLIVFASHRAGARSVSEFVREAVLKRAHTVLTPRSGGDRRNRAA